MSRSLLFIKTSSLGDVVHAMPAVSDLRAHAGAEAIHWVVEEAYAPLVRLHAGVERVIPVGYRRWRRGLGATATWREMRAFTRALESVDYDLVIDAQGLVKSAFMALAARGPRHGLDWSSAREPVASLFYRHSHPVPWSLHAIDRCRRLCALAGGYSVSGPPDFGLACRPPRGGTSGRGEALLLHATADPAKEWPEASWIELGRALAARGFAIQIPHGSQSELERALRLAAAIPEAAVPDRAPLDQMAERIAGAALVVGVDTGLLHLAAALSVPVVGIYVDTDPEATGPVGNGRIAVCGNIRRTVEVAEVLHAAGEVVDPTTLPPAPRAQFIGRFGVL